MRELVAAARERGARVATIGHDPALGDPFVELVEVPNGSVRPWRSSRRSCWRSASPSGGASTSTRVRLSKITMTR